MTSSAPGSDRFESIVAPILFAAAEASDRPTLSLALSASASGRTRVTGRLAARRAVVNARDLEVLAHQLAPTEPADSVAADWLPRALAEARRRRVSLTVEGTFRSPGLVSRIAHMFAEDGYATQVAVVAERLAEVQMSDASRRFDVRLRRAADGVGFPDASALELGPLVHTAVSTGAIDRVLVVARDGATVVDAERGDPSYESAATAFTDAAAQPLGTLTSALWLSELRHMTRLLTQQHTAPRWAIDDLITLHELALSDVLPDLPISDELETRAIESERIAGVLSALRKSVAPEVADQAGPIAVPQVDGAALSR